MLTLSDEISVFIERKIPLLRIHKYDGIKCTCGKPECQWDAKKGGNAGKHPAEARGVHSARVVQNTSLFEGFNVGVACGRGFVVLDIDPRNGGDQSLDELIAANEPLPRTWQVATGGGGTHYYFSVEGEQRSGKRVSGIDLVGLGGYVLAAGSLHPNGRSYEWLIHPDECDIAPLPEWVRDACCGIPVDRPSGQGVTLDSIYDEQDLRDALTFLDPDMPEPQWFEIGMCIHSAGFPMEIWDAWSKGSDRYDQKVLKEKWSRFVANKPGGKTVGSLFKLAEKAGWTPRPVEKWDFAVLQPEPEPEPKTRNERKIPDGIIGIETQNLYDSVMHKDKGFCLETILFCIAVCAQMRFRTSVKKGVLHRYSALLTPSGGGKAEYTNAAKKILKQVNDLLLIGDCASGQALRMAMKQCPSRGMIRDEGVERLIAILNEKDANAVRLHEDFLSMWGGSPLEEIITKDAANSSPQIDNPHMSFLFGGPTSSFEEMLKNGKAFATKGLLSRMDIIFGTPTKPKSGEFSESKTYEPRKEFIELLKKIAKLEITFDSKKNEKTVLKPEIVLTRWESDEVRFLFDDFASDCYDQTQSYTHPAVWSRAAERSMRDATLWAIAENHEKPTITRKHMEWAKSDALWRLEPVKNKCEEFLGKSDETKARDAIVNVLKKEGGRCSRRRVGKWWRQWDSLDERIRQAAVDGLERDGTIAVKVSGANRNKGEQILILISS